MGRIVRFQLVPILLFISVSLGCSSGELPAIEAEVRILNDSVYVWNRGTVDWSGGTVFLGRRSEEIQKSFRTVTPGGFAQLPLREFRKGSGPDATPVTVSDPTTVWVVMEGYAPARFEPDGTDR